MNPFLRWFHQLGSPPTFDRFAARWAPWCHAVALALVAWGVWLGLFGVPADYQQGDSFRILFIHVPSAWMSLFVFGLMAFYAAVAMIWHIKLCEILAIAAYSAISANTKMLIQADGTWMNRIRNESPCW